ncbi:MAG: glycoside hydrolase family 3 N-terminal domain-containing protein [Muribaculaceae bacterium]
MKKTLLMLLAAAIMALPTYGAAKKQSKTANKSVAQAQIDTRYRDASLPIDERIDILLSQMTVNEKVGQLLCPLGWPMYEKKGNKVDVSELYKKRMDTQPLGSLWAVLRADPWTQKTLITGLNPRLAAEAINKIQRYAVENTRLGIPLLIAEECPHGHMAIGTTVFPTALSQASTFNKQLMQRMGEVIALEARLQGANIGYGPVIDIAREPRWSRMEETFGEDPYLTGVLATQVVKGMQGDNIADGQHVFSTLKHFAAYGIPEGGLNGECANIGQRALLSEYAPQFRRAVEAGVGTIMTSYNAVDGVPCTGNRWLLTDVLRNQWGFNGFVYSDLQSIEGIAQTHHCAANYEEAAVIALKAGVDMDLEGNSFKHLAEAYEKGKITDDDLNRAVRNVLRKKFEMGLFENPYVDAATAQKIVRCDEHRQVAREVARQGIVLLKNDGLLPLSKDIKRVAVIGPNADVAYNQLGDYTAPQDRKELRTVLDGVRSHVSAATQVTYEKGCAIRDTTQSNIARAVQVAKEADVTILVVGGSSARDFKTEYISTGAAKVDENAALADMDSGEGYDRASLNLLGHQEKLMAALIDAGVKLVVVYIEGRPLNMNMAAEHANSLLTAWYPGEQGGEAVADVIFGDYNPAGRIPVGIPRNVGQIPVFYSKHPSHDYIDSKAAPLYSFGYGLSYTQFAYSDLQLAPGNGSDCYQTVTCTVTNTGSRDGDEVVQLYINDVVSSVETPHMLLKGFQRVSLRAGESKQVTFKLTFDDLALYDINLNHVVEPGTFRVMVGAASNDIRLKGSFEVN